MNQSQVYALGHTNERIELVPKLPGLEKILLPILQLPYAKMNGFDSPYGEGRLFLSDLEPPLVEYVGQFNARAEQKYHWNNFCWANLFTRGVKLLDQGDTVIAAWRTDSPPCSTDDWVAFSNSNHPGMLKLLEEMAKLTGLPLRRNRRGLWANDFACRREDWVKFRDFFRFVFLHFDDCYGPDLPFDGSNVDAARKPAYFYERVATHYFTNRLDLTIVQL